MWLLGVVCFLGVVFFDYYRGSCLREWMCSRYRGVVVFGRYFIYFFIYSFYIFL